MKICFVFAALAATLLAQPPMPPDTVVAKVEGKPVTAAELQKMLDSAPPQFFEFFQQDPSLAIAQYFEMRHLGKEADKLKILDESPWKELFEFMRNQLLTQAMITREQNSYPVTSDQIDAYYAANRSKYEQAKIKAISIGF